MWASVSASSALTIPSIRMSIPGSHLFTARVMRSRSTRHMEGWSIPSPRIGVAWDVFGDGKTALRVGYGVFFEHGTADEANTGSLEASSPLVLDMTSLNPNSWNSIGGGFSYPLNVTEIPTKAVWPYVQQWSLSVERQLPKNMLGSVAYVGSKGTHLTAELQVNQLQPLGSSQNPFALHQPLLRSGQAFGTNLGDC